MMSDNIQLKNESQLSTLALRVTKKEDAIQFFESLQHAIMCSLNHKDIYCDCINLITSKPKRYNIPQQYYENFHTWTCTCYVNLYTYTSQTRPNILQPRIITSELYTSASSTTARASCTAYLNF